ncbi:protein-glutamate methylesterase/protein-glutamine glutaminase [Alkalihalobacterium bogoriense]|uniref:protein-glutamate methylesterase/protein-glutamine glutaminase n=1 Tax=Alkalihalobacterium bogoriense TaxID=246272 RepID=UPI000556145B|nr:chemotaxis response regulator protein-glutamate methylesterase [Alkalihalobacterium bogoriense]
MHVTKAIKVLVVDDSAFMRKLISDLLEEDSRITVVSTARNGADALKKMVEHQPDVMTLDVEMPVMDGLATLREIMRKHPLPVVMVSSTTKAGAENTLLAMDLGAVDFITKTSGSISLDLHKIKNVLIEKVILASTIDMKRLTKSNISKSRPKVEVSSAQVKQQLETFQSGTQKIIAIGTSTGGPKALQQVLKEIKANIAAPILIVQHMPAGFTKSLATRLNSLSSISVKEAEHHDILQNGSAYIAPGGKHLKLQKKGSTISIVLDESDVRRGHRPSVDVMYESLATIPHLTKMAVIMTGMGSDGTEGLHELKKSGNCYAVAESEETSIVFGMPKAAILSKNVDEVVNLADIAAKINAFA